MATTFSIPRKSDRELIKCIRAAISTSESKATIIVHLLTGEGIDLSKDRTKSNDKLEQALAVEAQVLTTVVLRDVQLKASGDLAKVTRATVPGVFDTLVVDPNSVPPASQPKVLHLYAELQRHLGLLVAPSSPHLPPEVLEAYARLDDRSSRLQTALEKLTEEHLTFRRDIQRESDEREKKRENEFEARRAELDNIHTKRLDALEVQEKDIEVRLKTIDDMSARDARRKNYAELKKLLDETLNEFKLSADTQALRQPVVIATATLALGLALSSIAAAWTIDGNDLSSIIRGFLPIAGFAATMFFYLKWAKDWAHQHAKEEFTLRHLRLDLGRAAYVVELAMEWEKEELPAELIERLTRGLFEEPDIANTQHPYEQLLAILTSASELKAPLAGGEISFDQKNLKKIGKLGKTKGK